MPDCKGNRLALKGRDSSLYAMLVGAIAVGSALPVDSAEAQTSAQAKPSESQVVSSDDVVVTARKRPESLQDTPVAIAAFTSEQLDRYAITGFADVTTLVPGMVVGRQGSGSASSIFLRGVGSSSLSAAFDQSVSFNVDGLPMSRGREINLSQYDLHDVQVLKGPQALFFGKNSTGGIIAVQSNDPSRELETSIKIGHGFDANENYAEGVLSGPLTKTVAARFAFRASTMDGFFDNTARPTVDSAQASVSPAGLNFVRTPGSDKLGGGDLASGRLTLTFDPTDDLHWNFKLGYTYNSDGGASELFERKCAAGRTTPAPNAVAGFSFPALDADCFIDGRADHAGLSREVARGIRYAKDGGLYSDLNSLYSTLNGTYDLKNWELTSTTGYYWFRQTDLDDVNGSTPLPVFYSQMAEYTQSSEEVRAQTKFDGPLNLMVGGFYSDSTFTYNSDVYFRPVPFDTVNQTYRSFGTNNGFRNESLSFFSEATWALLPKVELSGGARWSKEHRDSYNAAIPKADTSTLNAVFSETFRVNDSYSEENVSPEATIRWEITPDATVYAAYKEGFKAGGFNISLAPLNISPDLIRARNRYKAETATGGELGVRTRWFDRALQFNLTAYDYVYTNLQVQYLDPVTVSQVVSNAGELDVKGVEADLRYRVPEIHGLQFHAAVAYNDAKYADFVGLCYTGQDFNHGCTQSPNAAGIYTGQVYSGRTPPKAPEWGATYGADYNFPVFGKLTAELSADANYSSSYDYDNSLRPDAVQAAFTRLDASFALENEADRWRLALIGRNLTDEIVVTSSGELNNTGGGRTGNPPGAAPGTLNDINALVNRGREVYLELRIKLN